MMSRISGVRPLGRSVSSGGVVAPRSDVFGGRAALPTYGLNGIEDRLLVEVSHI
jgi:hypothetical protein